MRFQEGYEPRRSIDVDISRSATMEMAPESPISQVYFVLFHESVIELLKNFLNQIKERSFLRKSPIFCRKCAVSAVSFAQSAQFSIQKLSSDFSRPSTFNCIKPNKISVGNALTKIFNLFSRQVQFAYHKIQIYKINMLKVQYRIHHHNFLGMQNIPSNFPKVFYYNFDYTLIFQKTLLQFFY